MVEHSVRPLFSWEEQRLAVFFFFSIFFLSNGASNFEYPEGFSGLGRPFKVGLGSALNGEKPKEGLWEDWCISNDFRTLGCQLLSLSDR